MDSFNNLYTRSKGKTYELDKDDKNNVVQHIKAHRDIHDDIYALIRMYQIKTKGDNECHMKELKNGNIKINIDKIPPHLQHILHEYIKMNKNKNNDNIENGYER